MYCFVSLGNLKVSQTCCCLLHCETEAKSADDTASVHIYSGRFNSTMFNFKHSNVMYVEMSLYLAVHSHVFHLCSLFTCQKCPVASTWLCLLLSASAGIHSTGRVMLRVFICFATMHIVCCVNVTTTWCTR